jgi:hypothetical protein
MKKIILPIALLLAGVLFVGYYKAIDDAELNTVFFIKKSPTFQVKFENLFANDADNKKLNELNGEERELVVDYCKYRLGIVTTLSSQKELEACKPR